MEKERGRRRDEGGPSTRRCPKGCLILSALDGIEQGRWRRRREAEGERREDLLTATSPLPPYASAAMRKRGGPHLDTLEGGGEGGETGRGGGGGGGGVGGRL